MEKQLRNKKNKIKCNDFKVTRHEITLVLRLLHIKILISTIHKIVHLS